MPGRPMYATYDRQTIQGFAIGWRAKTARTHCMCTHAHTCPVFMPETKVLVSRMDRSPCSSRNSMKSCGGSTREKARNVSEEGRAHMSGKHRNKITACHSRYHSLLGRFSGLGYFATSTIGIRNDSLSGTDTLFSLWSDQALAIGPRGVVNRDLCGMRKASRPEHRDQGADGERKGGREGGRDGSGEQKKNSHFETHHASAPTKPQNVSPQNSRKKKSKSGGALRGRSRPDKRHRDTHFYQDLRTNFVNAAPSRRKNNAT